MEYLEAIFLLLMLVLYSSIGLSILYNLVRRLLSQLKKEAGKAAE
jgi:hypothetical protein